MRYGSIQSPEHAQEAMRRIIQHDLPAIQKPYPVNVDESGWYPFKLIGLKVEHSRFQIPSGWAAKNTSLGVSFFWHEWKGWNEKSIDEKIAAYRSR